MGEARIAFDCACQYSTRAWRRGRDRELKDVNEVQSKALDGAPADPAGGVTHPIRIERIAYVQVYYVVRDQTPNDYPRRGPLSLPNILRQTKKRPPVLRAVVEI